MKIRSLIDDFLDYLLLLSVILFTLSPIILPYYQNTTSKRNQEVINNVEILKYYGDPGSGVNHLRMDGHDCFTFKDNTKVAISCTRIPDK